MGARVGRFRRVYMESILEPASARELGGQKTTTTTTTTTTFVRVEGASFLNVSPRGVNIGRPKFNQNVKSKQNRQVCVKL